MFSRQATARAVHPSHAHDAQYVMPPPPMPAEAPGYAHAPAQPPQHAVANDAAPASAAKSKPVESVIGPDLKILGGGLRLISEGNLTVDGVVEGDVVGAKVTVGPNGQVSGTIHAETVAIHGQVSGIVRAADVSLKNGASVEAEVHHNTLSLELGATFEGRSRRYLERGELMPDLAEAIASARRGPADSAEDPLLRQA